MPLLQILVRLAMRLLFGARLVGSRAFLTEPGPAILMPNHVSWLDALLLWLFTPPEWRFVASGEIAGRSRILSWAIRSRKPFLVDPANPFALREVARHLQEGGRIILFPEGSLSHSGHLRKFFEGIGLLVTRTSPRIVPCYIRGAEDSFLGRKRGRKRFFPEIEVHFGTPRPTPLVTASKPADVRRRITTELRRMLLDFELEVELDRFPGRIEDAIFERAARTPRLPILEDSTGRKLDFATLAIGSRALGAVLSAKLSSRPRVGLLLPNSCGFALAFLALLRRRRTPAVLNFSTGTTAIASCVALADLGQVISSRAFVEAAKLDLSPLVEKGLEILFLEDLRAEVTPALRLAAWLREKGARFAPRKQGPSRDAAVVLFTSGSEGTPKGVVLSHRNLAANILQTVLMNDLLESDRVMNALPTFHCFGLTVGLLLPLVRGFWSFQYPSPLHYRTIPALIYDKNCTLFLSTSTFLAGYARRANPYDFHSLRRVFAGAEKLQESVAQHYAFVHGVRVLEGYGATECSPAIALNTALEPRKGSVGRLVPGMEARLEPVPGIEGAGRLFVRGPNVMHGYLNPASHGEFERLGGWYDTGDVARFDADGFLYLEGRLKRFAKVAGEMVSLPAVEETLARALGERHRCVVVALPDPRKGEALVVVTESTDLTLDGVWSILRDAGLPAIAFPREVHRVSEIPVLPTGKTDYARVVGSFAPTVS